MNSLAELRKQAEAAVRDMPDGDLKGRAFQTILTHLLASGPPAADRKAIPTKTTAQKDPSVQRKVPSSVGERLLSVKAEGFFNEQRSLAHIRQELKKNGWHYPVTSLSGPLQHLVRARELRREVGKDKDGRKGWRYSNP